MSNWSEDDVRAHMARIGASQEAPETHWANMHTFQPRGDGMCFCGAPEDHPEHHITEDRPESAIQQECVKLMQEDGWRALRTDPVSDRGKGKGFGEVGMADYLFIRYSDPPHSRMPNTRAKNSEIIWVEFKARKGKLSAAQNVWHRNERARGALTWIASVDFPASVEGFRTHYENSGLMRRAPWW